MLLDPLGTWRSVTEYPVSTNTGGRAIVVVSPQSAMYAVPPLSGNNIDWFPYVSVNPTNGNQAYVGGNWRPGPFLPQVTTTVGWLPDMTKAYFTSTLSVLNAAGRIFCGVFY